MKSILYYLLSPVRTYIKLRTPIHMYQHSNSKTCITTTQYKNKNQNQDEEGKSVQKRKPTYFRIHKVNNFLRVYDNTANMSTIWNGAPIFLRKEDALRFVAEHNPYMRCRA